MISPGVPSSQRGVMRLAAVGAAVAELVALRAVVTKYRPVGLERAVLTPAVYALVRPELQQHRPKASPPMRVVGAARTGARRGDHRVAGVAAKACRNFGCAGHGLVELDHGLAQRDHVERAVRCGALGRALPGGGRR